jgi:hypothetical protein
MRKLTVVLLLTTAISFFSLDAFACGDKFLVVGRGIRYERAYPAVHPSSILLYTHDAKLNKDLGSALKKSGHKIQTTSDEAALFKNLQTSKYDLVLLNMNDVALLESKVMATPSKPSVLPIIYNVNGGELDAAKKKYSCVLKYGDKNKNAVKVIDDVMGAKKKGEPLACKWTK